MASENPYHSWGEGLLSGTLTERMTKFGGNTPLGINSLYRAFNGLKINHHCLKSS